jgi:hypothetical protein
LTIWSPELKFKASPHYFYQEHAMFVGTPEDFTKAGSVAQLERVSEAKDLRAVFADVTGKPTKTKKSGVVRAKSAPLPELMVACEGCGALVVISSIVGDGGLCGECSIPAEVEAEVEVIPAPEPKAEPAKVAKVEATKETKIAKTAKTELENGLHYSLLTRVRNAFTEAKAKELEAGHEVLTLVDGRGQAQQISSFWVGQAEQLGGAEYLSSVRTSNVKATLKAQGVSLK